MMIVIDNVEGEDISYIIMADDGKGSSVNIPSFLISNSDGMKILDAIGEEWKEISYEEDFESLPKEGEEVTTAEGEQWENDDYFYEDEVEYKKGQKVIVQAHIDIAEPTSGAVHVDLWYTSIYELFNSGWDFRELAKV